MEKMDIVRNLDPLGRIVLPKQFREELGLNEGTPVAIFCDGRSIILKRETERCIFCGYDENIVYWENKPLCAACLSQLRQK